MEPLRTRLLNTSAVLLQWSPPRQPGGPQPLYILRTVSEANGVNYTQADTQVPGQSVSPLRVSRQLTDGRTDCVSQCGG